MDTKTKTELDQIRRAEKKKMKKAARKRFVKAMFSRRIVIVGAIGFVIILLAAVFAPVLTPYEPDAMDADAQLALPSAAHLLGTDNFGRDIFTRLLYGARISLIIGVFVGTYSSVFLCSPLFYELTRKENLSKYAIRCNRRQSAVSVE